MSAKLTAESPDRWRLIGEVQPDNALALRSEGERLLKVAGNLIEIDLSGITRSTSVVLSVFLCWQRASETLGKRCQFINPPASLQDVARVSNLDHLLFDA